MLEVYCLLGNGCYNFTDVRVRNRKTRLHTSNKRALRQQFCIIFGNRTGPARTASIMGRTLRLAMFAHHILLTYFILFFKKMLFYSQSIDSDSAQQANLNQIK